MHTLLATRSFKFTLTQAQTTAVASPQIRVPLLLTALRIPAGYIGVRCTV